jgi:hypothetical protein
LGSLTAGAAALGDIVPAAEALLLYVVSLSALLPALLPALLRYYLWLSAVETVFWLL